MPRFRIYRIKDAALQSFRWAPHVAGQAQVKQKDYEPDVQVEAMTEYAAWAQLRSSAEPLSLGDLLEAEGGELRICKYVGFEQALWLTPEKAENS